MYKVPAFVNDFDQAKLFFEEYGIPYMEEVVGENAGKLLVEEAELGDRIFIHEAEGMLRRSRIREIGDHPNVFLDENGNQVVTFSPYHVEELPKGRPWLEMSEYSIYGNGTKTFVVRFGRKRELELLEEKIQEAEAKMLKSKKQYDAAVEKMAKLLEERNRLKKSLDGGRVSLKKWSFTWDGEAVWEYGSGQVECFYHAEMTFRQGKNGIRGPEVRNLEMHAPGFTDKDVIEALNKSLRMDLDAEFEEYCTEDDYYQPVVEDFEAEALVREWAEARGIELIRFEGRGSDGGYEPKGRYGRF